MKVVCAGHLVNRIDLGSADVGLVAALCCCTAHLRLVQDEYRGVRATAPQL